MQSYFVEKQVNDKCNVYNHSWNIKIQENDIKISLILISNVDYRS